MFDLEGEGCWGESPLDCLAQLCSMVLILSYRLNCLAQLCSMVRKFMSAGFVWHNYVNVSHMESPSEFPDTILFNCSHNLLAQLCSMVCISVLDGIAWHKYVPWFAHGVTERIA